MFPYSYNDHIVVTDESLELTAFGDGSPESPFGFPRYEDNDLRGVELWLEDCADQFDNVIEGTPLTLLARENEFYLVKTEDGRVGWVGEIQTAEDTHLLDSVPSFDGTYWIYHKGAGDENSYACLFSANRRAAGARISDGKRFASDWTLSMRRVKFDGLYFAWNGEEFVSRDEFDTPEGKIRYTISPDAEQLYDRLAG